MLNMQEQKGNSVWIKKNQSFFQRKRNNTRHNCGRKEEIQGIGLFSVRKTYEILLANLNCNPGSCLNKSLLHTKFVHFLNKK